MAEPLTLPELKQRIDVVRDDIDSVLAGLIVAGREWVENYTGLVLTNRTVTQRFDRFACVRDLAVWPVAEGADVSIAYADTSGNPQTVADARIDAYARPARIYPAYGAIWPYANDGSVVVSLNAGYETPAAVPETLKAAIAIYVRAIHEDGSISEGYMAALHALCHPYRLQMVA